MIVKHEQIISIYIICSSGQWPRWAPTIRKTRFYFLSRVTILANNSTRRRCRCSRVADILNRLLQLNQSTTLARLWSRPTFKKRANLSPARHATQTGELAQRRLQEEERCATGDEKQNIRYEEYTLGEKNNMLSSHFSVWQPLCNNHFGNASMLTCLSFKYCCNVHISVKLLQEIVKKFASCFLTWAPEVIWHLFTDFPNKSVAFLRRLPSGSGRTCNCYILHVGWTDIFTQTYLLRFCSRGTETSRSSPDRWCVLLRPGWTQSCWPTPLSGVWAPAVDRPQRSSGLIGSWTSFGPYWPRGATQGSQFDTVFSNVAALNIWQASYCCAKGLQVQIKYVTTRARMDTRLT